jgi:hypothetical protein
VNDYVRTLGTVEDIDGIKVAIGTDHDTVQVSTGGRFDAVQTEQFTRLFAAACQEARLNKRQMHEDAGEEIAAAEVYGGGDDAGFPLIPATQIAAEAAADMRRLMNEG